MDYGLVDKGIPCGRSNIMDVIKKGEAYLTFVFDGIDSKTVGVASVSTGGTYDTPIVPTFSDSFLEADGYNGRYYFDTKITQKDFSYSCFIDNLSAYHFDQLKAWIAPQKIGKLIRPEEPYRYYWVKVSSVENLPNIPLSHPDTGGVSYTGNFRITFTTVGQACGYGMFYYQDDLKYFEYKDIFQMGSDYYYDNGLLYRESSLPMKGTKTNGSWYPQIYNPGTYNSKIRMIIKPQEDVPTGTIVVSNETTGDVSYIRLKDVEKDSIISLDWGKGKYSLNDSIDLSENVVGDILFLTPRNFVETVLGASVSNDGSNTMVGLNPLKRQVRTEDIGKTVIFKREGTGEDPLDGAGGRIVSIDILNNTYALEEEAGLWTNSNTPVIITLLDKIKCDVNIPGGTELEIEWQVEPRYL